MSDDLMKRLRFLVSLNLPENGGPYTGLAAEQCLAAMTEAADRIATLEAERDRLREALSLIAVMGFSGDNAVARRIGELAVEQARAALVKP